MIVLDDDSVGVVKDTLAILASKEIKLTTLRRYGIIRKIFFFFFFFFFVE